MPNIDIGVGNVARRVKNIYVGVNNVARKVLNGFVGIGNLARLIFRSTPIKFERYPISEPRADYMHFLSVGQYTVQFGGGGDFTPTNRRIAVNSTGTISTASISVSAMYGTAANVGTSIQPSVGIFGTGTNTGVPPATNSIHGINSSLTVTNNVGTYTGSTWYTGYSWNSSLGVFYGGDTNPAGQANFQNYASGWNSNYTRITATTSNYTAESRGAPTGTTGSYALCPLGFYMRGSASAALNAVDAFNTSMVRSSAPALDSTVENSVISAYWGNYAILRRWSGMYRQNYNYNFYNNSLVRTLVPTTQFYGSVVPGKTNSVLYSFETSEERIYVAGGLNSYMKTSVYQIDSNLVKSLISDDIDLDAPLSGESVDVGPHWHQLGIGTALDYRYTDRGSMIRAQMFATQFTHIL